jgi:hypothetical protein
MCFFSKISFRLTVSAVMIGAFASSATTQTPNVDDLQVNDTPNGGRTAVHTWQDETGESYRDIRNWGMANLGAN